MQPATWKPEDTDRAERFWREYQKQHDLSKHNGKVAAIDPRTGRVWIDESGVEIADQMEQEGLTTPVYLVRIGSDSYIQKGKR